jgi:dienelactone hydrolase
MSTTISPSMTFSVGSETFVMDRYPPTPGTAKRPVVLMVHGLDGLSGASGIGIRKFAEQTSDAGYLVLVPHYFGTSDGPDSAPLPELVAQRLSNDADHRTRIAAAVDRALAETDADGERLGLVGFSLGGRQVVAYAEAAPAGQVRALVDFFGWLDSTMVAAADRLPPTLVLHNNADLIVSATISRDLAASLTTAGVEHDAVFYDDDNPEQKNHAFKSGGLADVDSRQRAIAWLRAHLA